VASIVVCGVLAYYLGHFLYVLVLTSYSMQKKNNGQNKFGTY